MTTAKYKFANAHEWLGHHIQQIDDPAKLRSLIRSFAILHDGDDIQDMFESEMDADGYFDETKSEE